MSIPFCFVFRGLGKRRVAMLTAGMDGPSLGRVTSGTLLAVRIIVEVRCIIAGGLKYESQAHAPMVGCSGGIETALRLQLLAVLRSDFKTSAVARPGMDERVRGTVLAPSGPHHSQPCGTRGTRVLCSSLALCSGTHGGAAASVEHFLVLILRADYDQRYCNTAIITTGTPLRKLVLLQLTRRIIPVYQYAHSVQLVATYISRYI
eukprot:716665-Rhodomonas_salina.2